MVFIKKHEIDEDTVKSYSFAINQHKSSDDSINVNYICPKYWDISKDVPIHPRDIHKYVDNITKILRQC